MNARCAKSIILFLLLAGGLAAASKEASLNGQPVSESAANEFDKFKLITERNIFDASRHAGSKAVEEAPKPKRSDTLTLVGTMNYEKGPHAFFDGSSSDFRKVLTPGQSIGGLTLKSVNGNNIKLAAGTNVLDVVVGMQLRRDEDADWQVSSTPVASSFEANSGHSSEPSSSGAESDIIKRLMKQREQELK